MCKMPTFLISSGFALETFGMENGRYSAVDLLQHLLD